MHHISSARGRGDRRAGCHESTVIRCALDVGTHNSGRKVVLAVYDGRPLQRRDVSDGERARLFQALLGHEPVLDELILDTQALSPLKPFTLHTSSEAPAHTVPIDWFRHRVAVHKSSSSWICWWVQDPIEAPLRLVTIETATSVLVCGLDESELRAWYLVARGGPGRQPASGWLP